MRRHGRLPAGYALLCLALLIGGCGGEFPVAPTPVATSAVALSGTRYQGTMTLANGTTTPFNMTLIARGLATRAVNSRIRATTSGTTVSGSFSTGNGLTGTVQGSLAGTLENGQFQGTLAATSGAQAEERNYSGPMTSSSAAWAPGECVQNCTPDGLSGAVQVVPDVPNPTPPCSFSLTSGATASFGVGGGNGTVSVTTTPNCAWSAEALPPPQGQKQWITIVGNATPVGSGSVAYTVDANPDAARDGKIRVAGHTVSVTQSAGVMPPTIATPPQNQSINSGGTALLTVAANGTAPFTYQWFIGPSGTTTNPIPNATGSSFTTPPLTATTTYWVRVSNAAGSVNSAAATISIVVVVPPTIATQPQSQNVNSGGTVLLTVAANGSTPFTYQWYLGPSGTTTSPIPNATGSSFTTPPLTTETSYWVRVSNAAGFANSATATIGITVLVVPPTIATPPQSQSVNSGSTALLSVAANGTTPFTYQWYTGPSGSTANPIPNATGSSYTTPPLAATTSYWVRVTNAAGHADSAAATLTVVVPPSIATQPQSQNVNSGGTVLLTVAANGTTPFTYQWYIGPSGTTTSPIPNATASSFTTPPLTTTTTYWVRVANGAGAADSAAATVTVVVPPSIVTSPQSQTVNSGTTVILSVAATGTPLLTYQWYIGPSGTTTNPIPNATASSYTTPPLTTTTSYWVRVSNAAGFVNTPTATITVVVPPSIATQPQSQTINSGSTALLSVAANGSTPFTYQWYVGPSGSTASPIPNATASSYMTPPLTTTTSYWCRVSNAAGSADSAAATITVPALCNPVPVHIELEPNDSSQAPRTQTIELGRSSGTFSFKYHTGLVADRLRVVYQGVTLFDTGCVATGTNVYVTQSIFYSGTSTSVVVEVTPNCAGGTGSGWDYEWTCPTAPPPAQAAGRTAYASPFPVTDTETWRHRQLHPVRRRAADVHMFTFDKDGKIYFTQAVFGGRVGPDTPIWPDDT